VRINAVGSAWCDADLEAVGDLAFGIRIPKTESADDVEWVSRRALGKPLICAVESARGVFVAQEIATVPGVRHLAMGGVDLQRVAAGKPVARRGSSSPATGARQPPALAKGHARRRRLLTNREAA
jgi:citrate lyase beta subunit